MSQDTLKRLARIVYATVRVSNKDYQVAPYTTTVQKVVYFVLASRASELVRKIYVPYLYGPYSADVAYVLDALNLAGFITIEYDEWGRRFRLADKERTLREEKEVKQVIEQLRKVSASILKDASDIATLAKVHWLASTYPTRTPADLVEIAQYLGWQLSINDIENCLSRLKSAGLSVSSS